MLDVKALEFERAGQPFRFSFSVDQGARVVVSGPSGAGKSTLFDLIAGFEQPASGSLNWGGQSLLGQTVAQRPLSFLFQANNLFAHLSVLRNVALGLSTRLRPRAEVRVAAEMALETVGLVGMSARLPEQLSGGQQQRVALARVLLQDRPLLLLDEPFSALDEDLRADLARLLTELAIKKRWTVLLISHDSTLLGGFATHHLRVEGGSANEVLSIPGLG